MAVVRVRVAKVLVVPPQVFRACREVMLRPDMAELVGQYSWGQNRCRSTVDKFASDSESGNVQGGNPGPKVPKVPSCIVSGKNILLCCIQSEE